MLYYYEEYGRFAEFTGYRGVSFQHVDLYLKAFRKQAQNVELQFFDADYIATEEHLYFAVLNALQAFKSKTNCSKSVAMEAMLYASAQRQISKAIEYIGVKPGSRSLAVAVVAEDKEVLENQLNTLTDYFGCAPNGAVLQLTEAKKRKIKAVFQVTEMELETQKTPTDRALVDLVIEQMALLSTQF
jgi:tRNA threonylcarbamoyladenosine modification (KEOPS) complex Cgi121 subunit